jgi:hypothetical protein
MKPKQEEALRDYLRESIVPLLEDVLTKKLGQAITFAKEELTAPVQEPVAQPASEEDMKVYRAIADNYRKDLAAAQRQWVGLTDEEIDDIYEQHHNQYAECISVSFGYERAIEAKLKELNT